MGKWTLISLILLNGCNQSPIRNRTLILNIGRDYLACTCELDLVNIKRITESYELDFELVINPQFIGQLEVGNIETSVKDVQMSNLIIVNGLGEEIIKLPLETLTEHPLILRSILKQSAKKHL